MVLFYYDGSCTYSNNPWGSSHETSAVVSSSNLTILGLGGESHEASSNKLVSLLQSSLLGCTKVTRSWALLLLAPLTMYLRCNMVEFCSSPTKNIWKHCQVYLFCIQLPCSRWPEASLGKKCQGPSNIFDY